MADTSRDDKLEFERGPLVEDITASIKKSLFPGYGRFLIIICLLIAVMAAAVIFLAVTARKKGVETEIYPAQSGPSVKAVRDLTKTVETRYGELNRKLDDLSEGESKILEGLNETLGEINKINVELKTLRGEMAASLEKEKANKKLSVAQPQGGLGKTGTLNRSEYYQYKIYIQYRDDEEMGLAEELRGFLKKRGFSVPPIEQVGYRQRDIRYFHREDRPAVTAVQNNITEFMSLYTKKEDFKLKIKYFGEIYPDARDGLIEVWIYF